MALVGALLLWVGIAQFENAYVPETRVVEGKVVRAAPFGGRAAIMFATDGPRFVLPASTLPQPTVQALTDATSVNVIYDARSVGQGRHAIVGLSVDGYVYYAPAAYQAFAGLLALVVLVPGALMFGFGASALLRRPESTDELDVPDLEGSTAVLQAVVIPFPRRQAPAEPA